MHPSVRYLHTFTAVCEAGSYRAAAEHLHLTQPAVAYQVKQLEEWAGVALVERQGRGIRITEAGQYLACVSGQIAEDLWTAVNRLRRGEQVAAKQVRIGTFQSFGRHVLMPLLNQREFQGLRFDLRFRTNEAILEALLKGDCDVGFVYQQPVSPVLRTERIGDEELVLAVPTQWKSQHRWRQLATYKHVPFVKYDEGAYAHGRWFETYFGEPPPLLLSDHHFSDIEEVLTMVAQGRGVSVVSKIACTDYACKSIALVQPVRGKRCVNPVYRAERVSQASIAAIDSISSLARERLKALQVATRRA
jgi:DNA-binding transcriptional LysR family regulator